MRTLLTLLFITVLCPAAYADNGDKFNFLLHFNDQNEEAFAYHLHCLGPQENLNETFLKTFRFVADELLTETIKRSPRVKPEYIKNKILKRRSDIQYKLDLVYMKISCSSPALAEAKAHYKEFSRYSTADISHFIDKQTKGEQQARN